MFRSTIKGYAWRIRYIIDIIYIDVLDLFDVLVIILLFYLQLSHISQQADTGQWNAALLRKGGR